MLYSLADRRVQVHETAFVAPSAQLIGSIVVEENASVWFQVVARGDNDVITIGRDSNIQDGSVLHTDAGIRLTIGTGVTVGHKVMLHGCEIGDYCLIGMNAVLLNRARIGKYCLIGANALVTEGKQIPDGSVLMGSPAKIVRSLSDNERVVLEGSAAHYVQNAKRYREQLVAER
ncbi:MAG TPA: gamma carbonic anhydrase family protein [Polyangiales bacterium]|nr:gamma carbonic anhydrase family protein [Polyangiales bacterium]